MPGRSNSALRRLTSRAWVAILASDMIRRLRAFVLCLGVFTATVSTSMGAFAAPSPSDVTEARKLIQKGEKAEKNKNWQDARSAYQQAIERNDTANGRLHLAAVEEKLGHLVEALEQYRLASEHKGATFAQKKKARDAIKAIEPRIPRIVVQVPSGFTGTVRIDDAELPSTSFGSAVPVNPGTRIVTARSDGFRPFEKSVVLSEGGRETVALSLEPLPAQPAAPTTSVDSGTSSGRKTWAYVGLAAGGVGVVVGTAFGLAARKTRNDLRDECLHDVCSEAQRDTYDRGKMQANISTVGFIVGGLGLGVGSYLLLTDPSEPEQAKKARISPFIGPASVGVEGSF